jgi:chitodextrinase
LLGIVKPRSANPLHRSAVAPLVTGGPDLSYHGGPVMRAHRVHAVYWAPAGHAFPAGYTSAIDAYLARVAADSGRTTNVYATGVQYTDGSGRGAYSVSSSDSFSDSQPFPAGGCLDTATPICLTDAQLTEELSSFIAARGLPRGLGDLYFIFTPQGVGSCEDTSSTSCAYVDGGYCAYHSAFDSPEGVTLYANQPYADVTGCWSGERPGGGAADSTINIVSHEHNEAITDPLGDGWYVTAPGQPDDGMENGDKCAWSFGGALGGAFGAEFNQRIDGFPYWLQTEWSNKDHGCRQSDQAPRPAFAAGADGLAVGRPVRFDATASVDPDGTVTRYEWDFGDGARASGPSPSHTFATGGPHTVTLTVTDDSLNVAAIKHTVFLPSALSASIQGPASPVRRGAAVAFQAGGSAGSPLSYRWSFGDGTSAAGFAPRHAYAASGHYTVRLTVTDGTGGTASAERGITVLAPPRGAVSLSAHQGLGRLLSRGLAVVLRSDQPAQARVVVYVRGRRVGSVAEPARAAGSRRLFVRLTRRGADELRRLRRVDFVVHLKLVDALSQTAFLRRRASVQR